MKLALHIGTAKTGTTSLQTWFATNRDALGAQGVWYPRAPGAENHRKLMVHARDSDKPDPSFGKFGIRTPAEHEAFRTRLRHDLTVEVAASQRLGHHIWVMSSEHLHSKITTPAMITRLHDLLSPLFDDITIHLHLRPQIDLLVSNASQRARMGRPVTRAELTRDAVSSSSSRPRSACSSNGSGSEPAKHGESCGMLRCWGLNSTTRMPHSRASASSAATGSGLRLR